MNYESADQRLDGATSPSDEGDSAEERTENTPDNGEPVLSSANGTAPESNAVIPETEAESPDKDSDEDQEREEVVSEVTTEDQAKVADEEDAAEHEAKATQDVDSDEDDEDDEDETVSRVATEDQIEVEEEIADAVEVIDGTDDNDTEELDVETISKMASEIQANSRASDEAHEETSVTPSESATIFGEMTLSTNQAAEWLRTVATALEEGELIAQPEDVSVPRKVTYKVELEQEHEGDIASLKFEIDVTVAWRYLADEGEE